MVLTYITPKQTNHQENLVIYKGKLKAGLGEQYI